MTSWPAASGGDVAGLSLECSLISATRHWYSAIGEMTRWLLVFVFEDVCLLFAVLLWRKVCLMKLRVIHFQLSRFRYFNQATPRALKVTSLSCKAHSNSGVSQVNHPILAILKIKFISQSELVSSKIAWVSISSGRMDIKRVVKGGGESTEPFSSPEYVTSVSSKKPGLYQFFFFPMKS